MGKFPSRKLSGGSLVGPTLYKILILNIKNPTNVNETFIDCYRMALVFLSQMFENCIL